MSDVTHKSGNLLYGLAGASVAGVGGFLFGLFVAVVAASSPASSQIVAPQAFPFIFTLGGSIAGFFLGYQENVG